MPSSAVYPGSRGRIARYVRRVHREIYYTMRIYTAIYTPIHGYACILDKRYADGSS